MLNLQLFFLNSRRNIIKKNMSRMTRISDFIEALPSGSSIDGVQSILFTADLNQIGGSNGGNCTNALYKQCHKAKNSGSCINYNSACPDSKNGSNCITTTRPEPESYPPGSINPQK